MSDEQQNNYNLLYVQRQEQLLVEAIRKSIDLEVRVSIFSKAIQDQRAEYDNLNNQLEVQIDINNQACVSVEDLTMKVHDYEHKTKTLQEKIQVLESNYFQRLPVSVAGRFQDPVAGWYKALQYAWRHPGWGRLYAAAPRDQGGRHYRRLPVHAALFHRSHTPVHR